MALREYQGKINRETLEAWAAGARVAMAVLPTGAGKTVCMGDIARNWNGWGTAIAHRGELVSQISKAFAREGIVHKVICSEATRRSIQADHYEDFGRSFINQGKADWAVASVDTIIKRPNEEAFKRSTLAIEDEGHHALKSNKWGKVFGMFTPECKGLLYTATPIRTDGKGLGIGFDGIVDMLIEGPGMGWMINNGYLTDYDVACPTVRDLDLSHIKQTTTGELSQTQLAEIFAKSKQIVGDVVSHYLELAPGKLGITFAVNIDEANKIAAEFCRRGVPALVVSANSTDDERRGALRKFKNREVLQLVNVDLFGEGFDLPAIEVVSMARPTASLSLFYQQFGRALRLMISPILQAAWDTYTPEQRRAFIKASNKPRAIIIDHVGNLIRHRGPPDREGIVWTLGSRRGGGASDAIPLRSCEKCYKHFERIYSKCPHCQTVQSPPEPSDRASPKTVDGMLEFVSQEVLNEMRKAVRKIDGACYVGEAQKGSPAEAAIHKRHAARLRAQQNLRHVVACWAGMYAADEHSVNQARFFHTFNIDVLTAFGLGLPEANELRERITAKMLLANTLIKELPFPDDATNWSNAA